MEDIEFLQHCGGMNPGERFYKMAPHLKPKYKSLSNTKCAYTNYYGDCKGGIDEKENGTAEFYISKEN